jgi:hypothetical protein
LVRLLKLVQDLLDARLRFFETSEALDAGAFCRDAPGETE